MGNAIALAPTTRTVLKNCIFANVSPNATTGIYQALLKPGSVYDPWGTLANVGSQLVSTWNTVYSAWVVEKFYLKLEFARTSPGSESTSFIATGYPSVESGAVLTYQDAASQNFARHVLCAPSDNTTSNTLSWSVDCGKFMNRRVTVADNGSSAWNTDPPPAQFVSFNLFIQNVTNSAQQITVKATLYQTVRLEKRKILANGTTGP